MRLAVLGNSHIACLKVAWANMRRADKLTFFGSRAGSIASLRYWDGKLTSDDVNVRDQFRITSEGLAEEITLSDFDALLIHGLVDIGGAASIFRHYSLEPGGLMLSHAAFEAVVDGWYDSQLLAPIVQQMPEDIRAIVTTTAAHAESVTLRSEWRFLDHIPAHYRAAIDDYLRTRLKFPVLRQPPETLRAPFLTRDEYSKNSVRLTAELNIPHPEDDFTHMNSDYGRLALRDVFHAIETTASSS